MSEPLRPYLTWSRKELWEATEKVINHYDPDKTLAYKRMRAEAHQACYSIHWFPMLEYNGCTAVQDPHHPHPACLIHDYDCIVNGWSEEYDEKFEYNNQLLGMNRKKAARWYKGVRLGWWLWYKWKK